MSIPIIIASLAICFFLHIVLYKQSGRMGLLEIPGGRKLHQGATPLIGGIAIYLSCVIILVIFPLNTFTKNFIFLLSPIVLIGIIDDIFDISAKLRLAFQFLVSIIGVNVLALDIGISHLFPDEFFLAKIISQIITILFVVTLMNAINMIDGMDGLAGFLLLFSLLAIAYLQTMSPAGNTNQLLNVLIPGLVIFLLFNLALKSGYYYGKVFMGDAGSMFLGFFLAAHLIHTTQGFYQLESTPFFSCLWFVFLPLADMSSTLLGRMIRRKSPFKADRTHIHHILQRAGLHKHKVLQLLIFIHMMFIGIGILSFHLNPNPFFTLGLLLLVFTLYRLLLSKAPQFIRINNRQAKQQLKVMAKNDIATTEDIYNGISI